MKFFDLKTKFFALVCLVMSATAQAKYIVSENASDPEMVYISKNSDGSLTIEACRKTSHINFEPNSCYVLGTQAKYTANELSKKRRNLRLAGAGVAVMDTAIVAAITAGGFFGGLAIAPTTYSLLTGPGTGIYGVGGAVVGTGTGFSLVTLVERINPLKRFKRASKISEILIDENGIVTVKDIQKYIAELDAALK